MPTTDKTRPDFENYDDIELESIHPHGLDHSQGLHGLMSQAHRSGNPTSRSVSPQNTGFTDSAHHSRGTHSNTSGSPARRPGVPRLKLDTSNLSDNPVENELRSAAPQSAILGMANVENLQIDSWLPEEQERSSPVSPSKSLRSASFHTPPKHHHSRSRGSSVGDDSGDGLMSTHHPRNSLQHSASLRIPGIPRRSRSPSDSSRNRSLSPGSPQEKRRSPRGSSEGRRSWLGDHRRSWDIRRASRLDVWHGHRFDSRHRAEADELHREASPAEIHANIRVTSPPPDSEQQIDGNNTPVNEEQNEEPERVSQPADIENVGPSFVPRVRGPPLGAPILMQSSSKINRENSTTSLPPDSEMRPRQHSLTVERSFQHRGGEDTPLKLSHGGRDLNDDVFVPTVEARFGSPKLSDDGHIHGIHDSGYYSSAHHSSATTSHVRTPSNAHNNSSLRPMKTPLDSLDHSYQGFQLEPTNSDELHGRSASPLKDHEHQSRHYHSMLKPENAEGHNLSLSGAAFISQRDILESELNPRHSRYLSVNEYAVDGSDDERGDAYSTTGRRRGSRRGSYHSGLSSVSSRGSVAYPEDDKTQLRTESMGRTLFYFTAENWLRGFLIRVFATPYVFYLEFVLTLLQIIGISVEVSHPFHTTNDGLPVILNPHVSRVYVVVYCFYTLLMMLRAIAFGIVTREVITAHRLRKFIAIQTRRVAALLSFGAMNVPPHKPGYDLKMSHDGCVLRSSWGRVDFLSIVFFWLFEGLSQNSYVNSLELIIAGLSHLRILRMLDYIVYTRFVLHVMKRAIPLLENVLIFIGFFLFIWGIIGVLSFNGSLRRVCIYNDIITSQNCGSWLEPGTLKKMPYLLLDSARGTYQTQSTVKGYTCPVHSKCVELRAFPPYGSFSAMANMSFDNIFNSLEIVFIMMSANGFTQIMYDIIDSEYLSSSLFFISGVLILGVWLMNLLVAVMVSSYGAIKENFMSATENRDPIVKYFRRILLRLYTPRQKLLTGDNDVPDTFQEQRNHGKWILENTTAGRRYNTFSPLFAVLTLIDLVVQAARTPPDMGLFWWEVVLAVVFAVDVIVRFVVYLPYWRYFFVSFTNVMDIFLSVANIVILAFHRHEAVYSWLTVFQLLRIHKMVASLRYSRTFWIQVFGNIKALVSLTLFFFMTTYLCTLIASKMLRGQFPMEGDDGLNVSSFYDLAASFISMQQVASTENWTDILFWVTENVSRPGESVVGLACMGILFSAWLFFANFLIFNLFLGIMSESLHGAISNKREEQVRQFAEEVREKSMNPSGPRLGSFLSSLGYSGSGYDEYAHGERPVTLREKLMATGMRWLRNDHETPVVFRPIRAHIERKLVIQFLETHGDLEQFSGGELVAGKTFLNLQGEAQFSTFGRWKSLSIYQRGRSFLSWSYSMFHNYPRDYREFVHERFHRRHSTLQPMSSNNYVNANDDVNAARGQAERGQVEGSEVNHERTIEEAHAIAKKAYVEEIFDHNLHHLAALDEYCATHPHFDRSLMLFDVTSPVRQFFQRLFNSSSGARRSKIYPRTSVGFYVRFFFLLATVTIVVQTCINTPLEMLKDSIPSHWTRARVIDVVYGAIFTAEFVGKVIADGFHFTPNAYTRSIWNCLDLIVLISIWMTFINDWVDGGLSRYLRALMALRALRLISYFKKSEMMLWSIFKYGLRNITGACLIAASIVIPYAIWGKNIFHDRLNQCNDGSIDYLSECTGEYVATVFDNFEMLAPRVVQGEYFSYDNFWQALLIQFGVLSLEGWIDVLQAVTSITGINEQPDTYASKGNATFPIVYNYIGAVVIMSMLIAVIIRNYALTMGTAFLTEEQLSWIDVKRSLRMIHPTPRPPRYKQGSLRDQLLKIIPTWIASIEIWTLLVVTAELSAYFYPLKSSLQDVYYLILLGCSLLLLMTSLLKLVILKPTLFFHNLWNPFGLLICLITVIVTITDLMLPDSRSSGADAASRGASICLLLLWIPRIKRLYQFYTIGTAAIAEIGMLLFAWFVLYIAYAIALNQSFGVTKLGSQSTWSRNFRTIPKALIALFTMSCGEGWNQFLIDFTISKPYCLENSKNSECGISGFAYFLFITWNLLSMYVFANLFISLVCEACWYVYRGGAVNIRESDILSLLDSWQQFDPRGTGFIRVNDIYPFLRRSQGYFSLSIFSQDPKYNVRAILDATNHRVQYAADPYYVDMDAINAYLKDMPVQAYRAKRDLFELFVAQAQSQADPIPGGRGIRFEKLVLMFPLYKDMNPEDTLSLKEFLMLKVQLYEARVSLAAEFIARTWRAKHQRTESHSSSAKSSLGSALGSESDVGDAVAGSESAVYWVT